MATQTPISDRLPMTSEADGHAAGGASRLVHDLIVLGELQTQLVKLDAEEGIKSFFKPALLLAVGGAIGLFTLPMLMIALTLTIMQLTQLSAVAAAWITTVGGLFVAGLCVYLGLKGVRRDKNMFARSSTEWRSNLEWFKRSLKRSH